MPKENNLNNSRTKRVFAGTYEYLDKDTGEVTPGGTRYKNVTIKSPFVSMFLDDDKLYDVLNGLGSSGKVLAFILNDYDNKKCLFYFSSGKKQEMVDALKLSIGTVRSCVADFAESGLLIRVSGFEYMVNPKVFFKGRHETRNDFIEKFELLERERDAKLAAKIVDKK